MKRCRWVNLKNKLYIKYHDEEWGIPIYKDCKLFELLLLESFQAGLSWECILNKRQYFKEAFDNFNYKKISTYNDKKITELMNNKKIVRNKLKIKAAIKNAQIFIDIQKEYKSFSNYIWSFSNNKIIYETSKTSSQLSDKVAQDLQNRGMKFVGTTIIYSYLQAIGVINSHEKGCFLYKSSKDKMQRPLIFKISDLEQRSINDGLACYILGRSYDSGENGVFKNLEKAVYWYKEGTKKKDPRALYGLAACYYFGDGLKQDKKKAHKLFATAYHPLLDIIEKEKNSPDRQAFSIFCLAAYYYFGFGDIKKDEKKAFELIYRAAEMGHIAAIYDLGANFFYTGTGTKRDLKKSKYYLSLAAKYQLPRAKERLLEYQSTYQKEIKN